MRVAPRALAFFQAHIALVPREHRTIRRNVCEREEMILICFIFGLQPRSGERQNGSEKFEREKDQNRSENLFVCALQSGVKTSAALCAVFLSADGKVVVLYVSIGVSSFMVIRERFSSVCSELMMMMMTSAMKKGPIFSSLLGSSSIPARAAPK